LLGKGELSLLNEENRKFFEENNPWALEEIARRLLEAESRGLWNADPRVLESLKEIYLEIEGWLEERMGEGIKGDFQGGAVDTVIPEEIKSWSDKLAALQKDLVKDREKI